MRALELGNAGLIVLRLVIMLDDENLCGQLPPKLKAAFAHVSFSFERLGSISTDA